MATEWVGTVATAVVGLAGIGATLWTQKRGRENTLAVARESRAQDRMRAAYERLLTQAIETSEFVGEADLIWRRDAEPPDVDSKSYDAWLALDLYASKDFKSAYFAWYGAIGKLRDVLQELPENVAWYDAGDTVKTEFLSNKKDMEELLERLKGVARKELIAAHPPAASAKKR